MGVKVRERPKGSGVWWVFVDHHEVRKAKRCGSKETAQVTKQIVETNLLLGKPLFPGDKKAKIPTLKKHYEQFKKNYMETALKDATYDSYETSFRVHILPELGDLPLNEINLEKMQEFVAKLVRKPTYNQKEKDDTPTRTLSKDTIRLILAALNLVMGDALEKKLITENPASSLGKLYRQAPKRHEEIEPLNEEDSRLFLKTARRHSEDRFPLFLCALHTGMRSGELAGLKWGDVDWNEKFIQVKRQFVRGKVDTLKTKNAKREVDCSDSLIKSLAGHRSRCQARALKEGKELPEWIFANGNHRPLDMYNLKRRHFKKVLRKAGIRERRFHDLRHTFASILISQGKPITYVSKQLGHANPAITMRVYAKWVPREGQRHMMNDLPSLDQVEIQERKAS